MHLSDGQIRELIDDAVGPAERQQALLHLQSCQRCQAEMNQLEALGKQVQASLASLEKPAPVNRLSPGAARIRLAAQRAKLNQETLKMKNKWYQRIPRPAWAALFIVGSLAVMLTFAPLRAIANSFLGLFRVQQVQVVQVNPGDLPEQLGRSSQLEFMFNQDVQFQERGQPQEVASAAEASQMAGIPIRLPQAFQEEARLMIQPGGSATLTVNIQHLRSLLAEIGRSDIQIPDLLDGAIVDLQVPAGILAQLGACEFDPEQARLQGYDPDDKRTPRLPECTTLVQMPSPTISAPPGLDIQQIGEAYLQVLGMSRAEAEQFARTIDWTSTFVVPIPRYGTTYRNVTVDGVAGTLILQGQDEYAGQYLLMWVKDGIIYALTGPGDGDTALRMAASIQ